MKIRRTTGTVVTYLILTLFVSALLLGAWVLFDFAESEREPHYLHFLLASLLVVAFYQPLRALLEKTVLRGISYRYHRMVQALEKLEEEILSTVEYHEIVRLFTVRLAKILKTGAVALYVKEGPFFCLSAAADRGQLFTQKIDASGRWLASMEQSHNIRALRSDFQADDVLQTLIGEGFRYLVPLRNRNLLAGFVLLGEDVENQYHLTGQDKRVVARISSTIASHIESTRLYNIARKESIEKSTILRIAKLFNQAFELEDVLDLIIDSIKEAVPYDAAGIFLVTGAKHEIRQKITRGYDQERVLRLDLKIGKGLIGHAAKTGKHFIVKDVNFDEHYVMARESTRSQIVVPLFENQNVAGVLSLESDQLGAYSEDHLELLTALAGEAAVAIRNARLYEEIVRSREVEQELEIAAEIQRAFLPQRLPEMSNLDIESINIPCYTVGGDFFDIIKISDHTVVVSIGDVSGKGIPGAVLMASLYAGHKQLVKYQENTADMVHDLNNLLCENTAVGKYTTFFHSWIDTKDRYIEYTNAGHNPPLVIDARGTVRNLDKGGIVLGFLAEQPYEFERVKLEIGDTLVYYTDGISETFNSNEEEFGTDRIVQSVVACRGKNARETLQHILAQMEAFMGSEEQSDDMTLIVLKIG